MIGNDDVVWIKPDVLEERFDQMTPGLESIGMTMTLFAHFCAGGFRPFAFDAEAIAKKLSTPKEHITAAKVLKHEADMKKVFIELPDGLWIADPELYSQTDPYAEDDEDMQESPAPPPPPVLDVRGMEWMPFYGDRLFTSDTWLHASPEARCAALKLWWEAWKQCPAGSLPNSDVALAQLAGYGMMVASWRAVKEEALHGWVLSNDGRIYHPMVCELAAEAAGFKEHYDARQAGGKRRKQQERSDRTMLFDALRSRGIVPAFNTPTAELRRMASEASCSP